MLFTSEECLVFERYPNSASWKDVSEADQAIFKGVWTKLKELSNKLADSSKAPIPLKAFTSHYVPNGRSPKEIWSCVYPSSISNKSYGLQVALIISARGAEVCFCQGSGTSQLEESKKANLENSLMIMREKLGSVPERLVALVEKSQKRKWHYRKAWLTKPNEADFSSLAEWLVYASSPEGSAASVSLYFSSSELEALGANIYSVFEDALETFGPLLKEVYSASTSPRYWIFQGNPDHFDVDVYIGSRQEIVWTARQHKDRIFVGDRVLIWMSGAAGGVIADCSVIAPPSAEILEDATELWKETQDPKTGEMRCKLRVENSFSASPIARAAIRAALPQISIFRSPQGTNFEISQLDYETIMKLKEAEGFGLIADTAIARALLTKPFLILTGPSGTGKTRGAIQLAESLCDDACRAVVAVGADWTDNRHVVGFLNPLQTLDGTPNGTPIYETTAILNLLLHANAPENRDRPHVLILDEMNLSHVERYFADFLSAMELHDKRKALKLHSAGLAKTREKVDVEGSIDFPENLFVIGTVNIDETTYMFSPKVLDRANVIEIHADETALGNFLRDGTEKEGSEAQDYGISFLDLAREIRRKESSEGSVPLLPPALRIAAAERLMELFEIMKRGRGEFGFRTGREVMAYLRTAYFFTPEAERAAWAASDGQWLKALDAQILQKILPKLHGSRTRLAPLLGALATYCATGKKEDAMEHFPEGGNSPKRSLKNVNASGTIKFEHSYKKLERMIEVLVHRQRSKRHTICFC